LRVFLDTIGEDFWAEPMTACAEVDGAAPL
jgi:hypothetical protein